MQSSIDGGRRFLLRDWFHDDLFVDHDVVYHARFHEEFGTLVAEVAITSFSEFVFVGVNAGFQFLAFKKLFFLLVSYLINDVSTLYTCSCLGLWCDVLLKQNFLIFAFEHVNLDLCCVNF